MPQSRCRYMAGMKEKMFARYPYILEYISYPYYDTLVNAYDNWSCGLGGGKDEGAAPSEVARTHAFRRPLP